MNVAVFKEAQNAYARGDYDTALNGFIDCVRDTTDISPSDLSKFYHLIGNCYVKNGDPRQAASAYTHALQISPEKRKPALYVNLGTALLGAKEYGDALTAFTRALDYPVYTTPYKAYAGIGAAQLKLGHTAQAGTAYRQAALDPTNPDPAKALVNLGVCFMELDRAKDAITSYETALDFNLSPEAAAKVRANLGQAYLAEGRVNKALEAFEDATADGSYELTPLARHDYEIAKTLHERLESRVPGVLDTGFIPPLDIATAALPDGASADADEAAGASAEMQPDESGHLPVFGEAGFDPLAPQTLPLDAAQQQGRDEAEAQADGSTADEADDEPAAEDSASRRASAAPRRVAPGGVDEDELERTLVELGIAPEQASDRWRPVPEPDDEREDAPDETAGEASFPEEDLREGPDGASEEPQDSPERGAEPDAEPEPADPSVAKTIAMEPVVAGAGLDIATGEVPLVASDHSDGTDSEEAGLFTGDASEQVDVLGATQGFSPDGIVSDVADSGEPLRLENTDTHMPSPEDTQFFERTEGQIKQDAKEERKKARKSRGAGLKVAIVLVVLALAVVAAGAAAFALGYGYPTQEHVTRSYFAAVGNGSDTSQYWDAQIEQASRVEQDAVVQGLTSYSVEAVDRSMTQTSVYVKGTLQEGGQLEYRVVLNRRGLSWAIEYVELYFPSQQ